MMYELRILVQGYPGRSDHGGLGWSTVALVRSPKHNVLIDTGHYTHREILVERLGELGLQRDDIDAIAITHCHWDHCANFPFFPKAQVFVPRDDLAWAAAQQPGAYPPLAELHVEKLQSANNVTLLGDGDEFLPGLRALATPGHTPGHMAFIASGARGDYIFTGDAIKNSAELISRTVEMTIDRPKSLEAVQRVREMAAENPQNVVVFGHDRICSFDGEHVHELEPLRFKLTARLTEDFDHLTTFDLVCGGVHA